MKALKYLVFLSFLISLIGCDKNDDEKTLIQMWIHTLDY